MKENAFTTKPLGTILGMFKKFPELKTPESVKVFLCRFSEEKDFFNRNSSDLHSVIGTYLKTASSDSVRDILGMVISLGFWNDFGRDHFDKIVYEMLAKHFSPGTQDQKLQGNIMLLSYVREVAISSYNHQLRNLHCWINEAEVLEVLQAGKHEEVLMLTCSRRVRLTAQHKEYASVLGDSLPLVWYKYFGETNHFSRENTHYQACRKHLEHLWGSYPWLFKKRDAAHVFRFSEEIGRDILKRASGAVSQDDIWYGFAYSQKTASYNNFIRYYTACFIAEGVWQAAPETVKKMRAWCVRIASENPDALQSLQEKEEYRDIAACKILMKRFGMVPNVAESLNILGKRAKEASGHKFPKAATVLAPNLVKLLPYRKTGPELDSVQYEGLFTLISQGFLDTQVLDPSEYQAYADHAVSYLEREPEWHETVRSCAAALGITSEPLNEMLDYLYLKETGPVTDRNVSFRVMDLHHLKKSPEPEFYKSFLDSRVELPSAETVQGWLAQPGEHVQLSRIVSISKGWVPFPDRDAAFGLFSEIKDWPSGTRKLAFEVLKNSIEVSQFINAGKLHLLSSCFKEGLMVLTKEVEELLLKRINFEQLYLFSGFSEKIAQAEKEREKEAFLTV